MAPVWEQYKNWRERKRAQTLVESLEAWHTTCVEVTRICRQALFEPAVMDGDIGEVLDKVDRKLYQFRNQMTDARGEIKRYDPQLAKRLTQVTEEVYTLRNQTARFLIRAQGPHPFATGRPTDPKERSAYYLKALEDAGYQGRKVVDELKSNADSLWGDLQVLLEKAHRVLEA